MAKKKLHVKPIEEWKFKRNRNGDEHARNCADGYFLLKGQIPNVLEIHHVLCVHACSDNTFKEFTKDEKDFIHVCLGNTDWNINAAGNNIGLPRKWAYVQDPANLTGWGKLPCHQVDHNRYLATVNSWMTENVWRKMTSAEEAKKCEYLEGKNVAKLFDAGSDRWKKFLKARGKQKGGAKNCLDYCMSGRKDDADLNESWNVPFSMEPNEDAIPKRAKPGGSKLHRTGLLNMIK
jgi:hypothetical protein